MVVKAFVSGTRRYQSRREFAEGNGLNNTYMTRLGDDRVKPEIWYWATT